MRATKNFSNEKINLRNDLINAIITDGVNRYGGENNATVTGKYFRTNAGLRANRLVNGIA